MRLKLGQIEEAIGVWTYYWSMRKILLVEDDDALRNIYAMILESDNYELYTAKSAIEGLEELSRNRINLILLDLMMSEMDGLQMLREIRLIELYRDIPILILTNIGKNRIELGIKDKHVIGVHSKIDLLPEDLKFLVNKQITA